MYLYQIVPDKENWDSSKKERVLSNATLLCDAVMKYFFSSFFHFDSSFLVLVFLGQFSYSAGTIKPLPQHYITVHTTF